MERVLHRAAKGMVVFWLWLVLICAAGAQNISFISQSNPFNTNGVNYQYGDVWAEGNIACVGVFSPYSQGHGVGIFDISNPAAPVLLSNYYVSPANNNQFEQGVIRDHIGYFASWSGGGLHIVSLTNPASPVLLAKIGKNSGTVHNGHDDVHTMFLERTFLYEADHETPVVKIFDVSNPSLPVFKWNLTTTNTVRVHQITVVSNRLYTSGWGTNDTGIGKTDIWDVSNVGAQPPVYLGSVFSGANGHSSWPTPDNNTLVVCREIAGGDVGIYDISNPAAPSLLVTISPATMGLEADTPHNPVIVGNLLYLSWYQNGIQIFDLTDRTKPVRLGSYDTFPGTHTTLFQGNWGVFPHLGIDKLLLSDMQRGLLVLDASGVLAGANNHPPLLIQSPANLTVVQGEPAAFSSTFTGSLLRYQWRFNGTNLPGATQSSLAIPAAQPANSGNYQLVATNAYGAVTSSEATLSVIVPVGNLPSITSQPRDVAVYPRNSATFSVAVTGSAPFYFQWRRDGVDVPGATNDSLTLTNVQLPQAGNYSVAVWNSAGYTVSSNAELALLDSPYISNIRVTPGGRAAFITWNTTVPSDSQVQYEIAATNEASSGGFAMSSSIDETLTTNHTVLLTGLAAKTAYHFEVVSAAGTNHYLSGVYEFSTAGDVIVDNTDAVFTGNWTVSSLTSNRYGPDYAYAATVTGSATASATWTPNLLTPGRYNIYVMYPNGANRTADAGFTIAYDGGTLTSRINQKVNGGVWYLLAENFPFAKGSAGYVRLSNDASVAGDVVIADAVRFEYASDQDLVADGPAPAWWQEFYFGTNTDLALDPDGDGYTTGSEYVLGTSPVDRDSKLQVNVQPNGSNVTVNFRPYLNNRNYELLYRANLAGATWQTVPLETITAGIQGDGTATVPLAGAQGFYRLHVTLTTDAARSAALVSPKSRLVSPNGQEVVCGVLNRVYVK